MDQKAIVKIGADGELVACAKGLNASECGYTGGKVCGKCGAVAVMEKDDGSHVEFDEKMMKPKKVVAKETDAESMGEDVAGDEMEPTDMVAVRKRARKRRLNSMGMKSEDIADDGFLCAIERKMHSAGGDVCANCPGGCAPEANLPTVLEVEGIAEEMFGGKVLDSGYGYNSDLFLVEMQRKDGKVIEVIFDGTTSECMGWQMLNSAVTDGMSEKSLNGEAKVIGMDEAADIAVKSVEGDVMAIEADKFEGFDAWAVEINGVDGKSYDVYVGLDGEVIGYDTYTAEEAADIDAEAAEINLKRAYSMDARMRMAEAGEAMADGSYPIANGADLRNAIQSYGRAKDKEATKLHIVKRALDLGLTELLPAEWATAEKSAEDAELELKRAYGTEIRMQMAEAGEAMPDGSYPIRTAADLRNAIQAFGRAKDKAATKAHIMKRATDLGMEDMLPESWMTSGKSDDAEDSEFLASLMEFEVLSVETNLDQI